MTTIVLSPGTTYSMVLVLIYSISLLMYEIVLAMYSHFLHWSLFLNSLILERFVTLGILILWNYGLFHRRRISGLSWWRRTHWRHFAAWSDGQDVAAPQSEIWNKSASSTKAEGSQLVLSSSSILLSSAP